MKFICKHLILITAVIMMLGLFGCSKSDNLDIKTYKDAEPNTMLADYYERVVGTPEEQPYYELVMYTYSDDLVLLEEYKNGGTDSEELYNYLVPAEAAQKVFDAIRESGMESWNSRDLEGITGKIYVCKFPAGEGDYIRVSSENMPPDGVSAFGKVNSVMRSYARAEYAADLT